MGFRFRRREEVSNGLRRIFTAELRNAAESPRPVAVHEARKRIKKARGVLRLMQAQLGPEYKATNARLGDAGRQLSALRDAGAMLETLDTLEHEYPEELGQGQLTALHATLTLGKEKAEQAGEFEGVAATLLAVAAEAQHWRLAGKGFDAFEPGLAHAFRRGRKAWKKALATGSDEDFHEWRKRVKDHWYHVRLLKPCARKLSSYAKQLKQLEKWLGDDHNLVVLGQKLGKARPVRQLVARRRDELRGKAVASGQELYGVKPRKLVAKLRECWEAWRGDS